MRMRHPSRGLVGGVVLLQVLTVAGLFILWEHAPSLLAVGMVAYTFGLRHAVDADHIAAIDNTTRKLVGEGKRPFSIGLYFSLGHSSVVFVLTLLTAVSVQAFAAAGAAAERIGYIGTIISGLYLCLVGAANVGPFWQSVRALLRGAGTEGMGASGRGGLWSKAFDRVLRSIPDGPHMFWVGLLFGLGFETATEIALLAISASSAARGVPIWQVMVLPLAFAAGMSLVDAADGVLMTMTYEWAQASRRTQHVYNAIVTGLSVMAAFGVGTVEWLQVAVNGRTTGVPWLDGLLRIPFGWLGAGIVAVFAVLFLYLAWQRRVDPSPES
ncbi:HoxN/HupN/NixA family nickel/cobalt transporter [Alicyclobacillus contaminans]|uniref:HoxN/HupN/NixA family nickel/cobalt transporter n=1 Tax=Alicyclobacillus contaminans TaxID=392016 RepID=UPI000428BC20|nr:hypothetical protein [Alicyclobacillus contaminans]